MINEETNFEEAGEDLNDLTTDRMRSLRNLFPEAFGEGILDMDRLASLIGISSPEGADRYSFTWAGKRRAMQMLKLNKVGPWLLMDVTRTRPQPQRRANSVIPVSSRTETTQYLERPE